MEVKIGVQHANRELVLESEQTPEEVQEAVAAALSGKANLLQLTDDKGRRVIIPADRLAYVEIGEVSIRKVGFGAICSRSGHSRACPGCGVPRRGHDGGETCVAVVWLLRGAGPAQVSHPSKEEPCTGSG